jgi:hypothetical protein
LRRYPLLAINVIVGNENCSQETKSLCTIGRGAHRKDYGLYSSGA